MTHTGDNIVSFFKKAVVKLEELQVQTALGKAELAEKLEDLKKEVRQNVNQVKANLNATADKGKVKYDQIKGKLEHLEVQLALGRAETAEEWKKQKKNITSAIHDVKELLLKN